MASQPHLPGNGPAAGPLTALPSGRITGRLTPAFWIPLGWILVVLVSAATAGWWPMPAPDHMNWRHFAAPPGTAGGRVVLQEAESAGSYVHWLGTDTMGRDNLSRIVYGARVSLSVGLLAPLIGLVAGGLLGCIAGFYRGRLESVIVTAMDVILAFPGLVLLVVVSFYLGASLGKLILALGFLTLPAFCRVARAAALALAEREFVAAARLSGAGNLSILCREIIPNVTIPVAGYGLMVAAFLIMAEGALSFLGLGVPAPTPSWGGMIAEGKEILDAAPHVSGVPAAVLFLTVLSFNLIGDSIRSTIERQKGQL
ncbi:MAG: ABC transporter permease [Pseudomonadota bacterium]